MKPVLIVSLLVLAAGIYVEYQKDSSFSSTDVGSLMIGTGIGVFMGTIV